MNQTIKEILNRRSIRSYQSTPITDEHLATILDAGNHAPCGSGVQAWRFVAVRDEAFRKKIAAMALPRYVKWIDRAPAMFRRLRAEIDKVAADPVYYEAPVVVFVIGRGMTQDFDCPMVCENIMIAAQSMGVGSCWVYFGQLIMDDPEIRTAFEMKDGEKVFGPILLGYPNEQQPPRQPRSAPVVKII